MITVRLIILHDV